ncbi:23S rRNA (pseudouridine(1915)-N(3))-methyltransferase RlmH [Fusobacterium varium]|uniref:23S rRNA (pseudouridine(1915)-N(3))-methyltransferase RlmH n=1 Tax=Fusobacterium varium TaxID=856 RepID=UPI001F21A844|nr:23S rRNA (pseudouridine(1915)-N(3))-methyltransferase RlmH [Fusobacterium varium]MCF2672995.1 23S rRNA (pseudouridine(1915)-N(3))-methyltransferase RlmH [Fusobacterium varium]
MNVSIICVGKVKEKYIVEGINEFLKRMQSFAKMKIVELKEDGNDSSRNISIEKESEEILKTMEKLGGYNILLDIQGKNFSSEEMSEEIERLTVNGVSSINFIIGGSYGVSENVRKIVNMRLSFSKMTFPHQLMRLILCEQIYRWFSIIKNTKYHK